MALLAAVACVALSPVAQAAPKPRFTLKVDHAAVHSGEQVTATATAPTLCQWVLEWNGTRQVGTGRGLTASYTAPMVTRPTRIALHGTCFYDGTAPRTGSSAAASGSAQRLTVTVPPSWRDTVVVTVLPPGAAVNPPLSGGGSGHEGGGLPGTGGPALAVLLAALGSLVLGAAGVRASRRIAPQATT